MEYIKPWIKPVVLVGSIMLLALLFYFFVVDVLYPQKPSDPPPSEAFVASFQEGYEALNKAQSYIQEHRSGEQGEFMAKTDRDESLKMLEQAKNSFKYALRIDPSHEEAQHNFQLTQTLIDLVNSLKDPPDQKQEQQDQQQQQDQQKQEQQQQQQKPEQVPQPLEKDEFDAYLQELKDREQEERDQKQGALVEQPHADNKKDW